MPDQVYRDTAYGTVTIYEAWPEKLKQDWLNALIATGYVFPQPPFTPTYDTGAVYWIDNEGHLQAAPIDRYQLASAETAEALRVRYKGTEVKTLPFISGGGPMVSAAKVRYIRWTGVATMVPAGAMARAFSLNPEDQFPNVADHAVQSMLAAAGIG